MYAMIMMSDKNNNEYFSAVFKDILFEIGLVKNLKKL